MSGGRYNYAYSRFEDFAYDLAPNAKTPEPQNEQTLTEEQDEIPY